MKRIICLLIAFGLVFSFLASCVKGKSQEDNNESTGEETTNALNFKPVAELLPEFCELYCVPKIIDKERFERLIVSNVDNEADRDFLLAFYSLYAVKDWSYEDKTITFDSNIGDADHLVYILLPEINFKELQTLQDRVMDKYCPEYTHGDLAADWLCFGFTQEDVLERVVISSIGNTVVVKLEEDAAENSGSDDEHSLPGVVEGYEEYGVIEMSDEFLSVPLVPVMVTKERFESEFMSKITDENTLKRFLTFYTLYDISDPTLPPRVVDEIKESFPITEKYAIYYLDPNISNKEKSMLEETIKKFCPDYDHTDLALDSHICGYTQEDIINMQ